MSTDMSVEKPSAELLEFEKLPRVDLDNFKRQLPDLDPQETQEWIEALDDIARNVGPERADYILRKVLNRARQLRIGLPGLVQSRYTNTISTEQEPPCPGSQ